MARRQGQTVVITGASSGIGRAAALAFAAQHCRLVLVARRGESLSALARQCTERGGEALPIEVDVSSDTAAAEVAEGAVERFGGIDVWVNSAAVTMFAPFGEEPVSDLRRVIEVNALGTALASRAAVLHFREQGEGTLINVSSVLGRLPFPYQATYVMTKHAIRGLSAALRTELADAPRIHVCTVLPASVDTPFFDHAANYLGREVRAMAPVLSPERVAAAIVSCARRPRREVEVGSMARLGILASSVAPGLVEKVVARLDHRHFLDWPAPPTSGNLHQTLAVGGTVSGGWRAGKDRAARRLAAAVSLMLLVLTGSRK